MARFLEALRKQHSPSGESQVPRRDRRVGKAGSLATAVTLLLVPGIAAATMGNTGDSGGIQHSSVSVRHGQGEIHPEGEPSWCLAGEVKTGKARPRENSLVEVRFCSQDNPFEKWDVTIDEPAGERPTMVAQLHGLNLCISGVITKPRREAVLAVVNDCNLPTATLNPKEEDGAWEISSSRRSKLLSVPKHLKRYELYPVALWVDARLMRDPKAEDTENILFQLPSLSTAGGGNPAPPASS